ncbi:hypothetical protein DFP72DRAFT_1059482 [Ephemerocybe angulata]|uniref:Uncharacterized protein n=1 Tax=Ephemerocybe angulata TaxID=980116 RepID=A0A8H6IIM2_9AGAR|nr:hypothetical protein DFP72DRAFT_1059482 [Tulosesus angulatus]
MGGPRKTPAQKAAEKADKDAKKQAKEAAATAKAQEAQKAKKEKEAKEEKGKEEEAAAGCEIGWGDDHKLSQLILNAFTTDTKIKQGLYPPPGANPSGSKGGGKKKADWYWEIAKLVFTNHAVYGDAFAPALSITPLTVRAKVQKIWGTKIKNRLAKMTTITNTHKKTMGQTGQGLQAAKDITENTPLAATWAKIKAVCPWFFDMKNLIAERPNAVPVGLGNSATAIDLSILEPSGNEQADLEEGVDVKLPEASSDGPIGLEDWLNTSEAEVEDGEVANKPNHKRKAPGSDKEDNDDDDNDDDDDDAKQKIKPDDKEDEDIKPKLDNSNDVKPKVKSDTKPKANPPKKSKLEEFAAVAKEEEVTQQKRLDLERAKVNCTMKIRIEKEHAKTARAEAKFKYRLEKKKMKASMKMQARQARLGYGHSTMAGAVSGSDTFHAGRDLFDGATPMGPECDDPLQGMYLPDPIM